MKAPTCIKCGTRHWMSQPCAYKPDRMEPDDYQPPPIKITRPPPPKPPRPSRGTAKAYVGVRLPPELLQYIDGLSEVTGQTRTDVMIDLMERGRRAGGRE